LNSIPYDPLNAEEIVATDDLTITTGANKTLVLSAPTWRDEYPAIIIPVSGSAAPDSVSATVGGVVRQMYSFDGANTEERLSGSFEVPHDYMIGEAIEVHVHWRPVTTGTGVVKWFFDWEYSPANAAAISQTTLSKTEELATNKQLWHLITSIGNLPQPSTPFGIGGKIGFNLRRTPNDTDDTYTGEVLLEQISLHVPCDTNGSRQIYVK
jgi:hypothetical protein